MASVVGGALLVGVGDGLSSIGSWISFLSLFEATQKSYDYIPPIMVKLVSVVNIGSWG